MSGDTTDQQATNEKNLENLQIKDDNDPATSNEERVVNGSGDNATNDDSDDDSRKLFVGGLSWETTENDLREYFSKWGKVTQCIIKIDRVTGCSRGFGFVTLENEDCVSKVLEVAEHNLRNKKIDPKKAKPSREPMKKIFVGGIDPDLTEEQIRDYFSQFGQIESMDLPYDSQKGKRKNYIFVCFKNSASAKKAIAKERQEICGKNCDVRLAVTREQASRQKALKQLNSWFEHPYPYSSYGYTDFLGTYPVDPYCYYGYDYFSNPAAMPQPAAAAPAHSNYSNLYSDPNVLAAANLFRPSGSGAQSGASPMKPLSVAHQLPHNHAAAAAAAAAHHNAYGRATGTAPSGQLGARVGSAAAAAAAAAVAAMHPHHQAATSHQQAQQQVAAHAYGNPNGSLHHPNGPTPGNPHPAGQGGAPIMDHEYTGMWQSQSGAQQASYNRA